VENMFELNDDNHAINITGILDMMKLNTWNFLIQLLQDCLMYEYSETRYQSHM